MYDLIEAFAANILYLLLGNNIFSINSSAGTNSRWATFCQRKILYLLEITSILHLYSACGLGKILGILIRNFGHNPHASWTQLNLSV